MQSMVDEMPTHSPYNLRRPYASGGILVSLLYDSSRKPETSYAQLL
ncbi:hypothetical protein N9219_01765 [bacterium]|nr:hypothetical protein [bacterium]